MSTTIPKSAFSFLTELGKNNNREWFNENKPKFKEQEAIVKSFFNHLMEEMNEHDDIETVKVFRIYRDIRFSKDKTPFKKSLSGSFKRATPSLRGGYYLHLEPGATMIGGGFWNPSKEDLYRIRKEFEMDDEPMRKIMKSNKFKEFFGQHGLHGEELKSAPRDFDKDHPAIDLIRKKSFIVRRDFTDKEVHAKDFLDQANQTFKAMRPYFDYMSEVLTTNLNGESLL